MRTILVTGAAGFIGSSFVRLALKNNFKVLILDSLTYAGHYENIEDVIDNENCIFIKGSITDGKLLEQIFTKNSIDALLNFAAESHVDNSITGPQTFIETNIIGTYTLLEASRKYWATLTEERKKDFRYLQISTDEVFGALGNEGKFTEKTSYAPNSPYSASKASADHLVRAWHHTYGLPTLTTNCSNNYGPRQFPEKLIPLMIMRGISNGPLPVYGAGQNIRDWIHVEDHCRGILLALEKGTPGQTYCFGGNSERNNLQVVKSICQILDELRPNNDGRPHEANISFVKDRPGHDWRYAIDDTYAQKTLGFVREYKSFEDGLRQTIQWYLNNQAWIKQVTNKHTK